MITETQIRTIVHYKCPVNTNMKSAAVYAITRSRGPMLREQINTVWCIGNSMCNRLLGICNGAFKKTKNIKTGVMQYQFLYQMNYPTILNDCKLI